MSRRRSRSVSTNTRTGGRALPLPRRSLPRASESIPRRSRALALDLFDVLDSPVADFDVVSAFRPLEFLAGPVARVLYPPRPPVRNLRTARLRAFSPVFSPSVERDLGVCRARRQRREVLFAIGVGGRRGGSPGPYRRTLDSSYRCR